MLYTVFSLPRAGSHFLQGGLLTHPQVKDEDEAFAGSGEELQDRKTNLEAKQSSDAWHGLLVKPHHMQRASTRAWLSAHSAKTVLLERGNKLKQAVSLKKARQTGVWRVGYHSVDGNEQKTTVRVTKADIADLDRQTRALRRIVLTEMPDPLLVRYEDLCSNYHENVQSVLNHLQLNSEGVDVQTKTEKQQTRSPRQNISNYNELKTECRGTKFERWFEQ